MSYYEDLGVQPGASASEIDRAHKKLASKYHPDREGGDVALFQLMQKAFDVLSDPERRRFYDQHGVDKNAQPSIRERALQTLSSSFIQMALHEETNVDYEDLVTKMRDMIVADQQTIPERKTKALQKIELLERVIRRVKGPDYLHTMLTKQISGIRVGIATLNDAKLIGDEMLALLKDYQYRVEQPRF